MYRGTTGQDERSELFAFSISIVGIEMLLESLLLIPYGLKIW